MLLVGLKRKTFLALILIRLGVVRRELSVIYCISRDKKNTVLKNFYIDIDV